MTGSANILAGLFVLVGALFVAISAIGILRLPDFYTRVHSGAKAGTVGSALMLVALAIVSTETGEVLRAIAAIVFFFLTVPISAHLLGKAAYSVGYKFWEGSVQNEMPAMRPEPSGGSVDPKGEAGRDEGGRAEGLGRSERREDAAARGDEGRVGEVG